MMASMWAKTGNLDDLLTVVHDCNKQMYLLKQNASLIILNEEHPTEFIS
jgi:hypothetical protein